MNFSDSTSTTGELTVLYQDRQVVAIDKPAGLLVHRSRVDVRAWEFALQKLRDQLGQLVYPVHRLDRPTSGVLLFGLDSDSARQLSEQFAQRKVDKSYRAIVRGHTAEKGHWDEALREKHDRMTDAKAKNNKPPQPAVTEFQTVNRWQIPFSTGKYPSSRYSEVIVRPLMGRKHQIRRHFNHFAHPVIGDTTHGDRRHNRLFREELGIHRLLLVAQSLQFQHPVTKKTILVTAPLGELFEKAIQQLDSFDEIIAEPGG